VANYIGAIDQGTTSSRFIVFDRGGRVISVSQKEHEQIYPNPGLVEQHPDEVWQRTREVIAGAMASGNLKPQDLARNWHYQPNARRPWCGTASRGKRWRNALVWQDTRVADYVSELAKAAGRIAFARRPDCRLRRISAD